MLHIKVLLFCKIFMFELPLISMEQDIHHNSSKHLSHLGRYFYPDIISLPLKVWSLFW